MGSGGKMVCRRAGPALLTLAAVLAGCGTTELFGTYDVPESPEVAEAPWPRLVDTPTPPPQGTYGPGVPDPAQGVAVVSDLTSVATDSAARAETLRDPVLGESDLKQLRR